jgi:HEAT repeat protein
VDLSALSDTPPWDWPPATGDALLAALRDKKRPLADRLNAAEMGGDLCVMNDEIAHALLLVLYSADEPEELRAKAAASLGPALEQTDIEGFEDDGIAEPPVSEPTFLAMQETLHRVYSDGGAPTILRRRALEASVRAQQDWHAAAIREAYSSAEQEWRLTAVFAMQYVPGFDREILESLESPDSEIRFEAVRAAGARGLKAAWPRIEAILTSPPTDKDLLLAAIEASANFDSEEAAPILAELSADEDDEIAGAATDALAMMGPDDEDSF